MDREDYLFKLEKDLRQIMQTKQGRRLFLSSLPLLLAGCATVTSDRYREGNNQGQNTSLTIKDEQKMTQDYLPQMKKDYPPLENDYLQNYINDLGQKIVHENSLHNSPYKYNFTLVESKSINAFALPAGTVFVTKPLLKMTETEAELAGVIGHEIGHVQARHTAERIDKAKKEESKTLLYGLGGLLAGGLLGHGLSKALCKPKDKECIERITKYGAMAGAAGGLLIQKYGFMANSQEDEMEADRIGFRTSVKAGFDKDHVGNFYQKLLALEKKHAQKNNQLLAKFADAMSTHPPTQKRVNQMREMAKNQPGNIKSVKSSSQYIKIKKII